MSVKLYSWVLKIGLLCGPLVLISQTTVTDNINHNGINRNFRLFFPSSYETSEEPMALVFNFHGFTSTAIQQEQSTEMNIIAENNNFIACYPNGVNRAWNVGWSFGSMADDVDFISQLIDDLSEKYRIDQRRVYACGMSNGGFMSFRLACELSHRIAAVASVTGSMIPQAIDQCQPNKAVPILQIHGTQDFVVNYNGSGIAAPISDVIDFWKMNNKCPDSSVNTMLPDINMQDNTTTEIISYGPCDNQTEVIHYKITNGGHTWPKLNATGVGTSRDFEASQVIWDFFDKYTLTNNTNTTDEKVLEVAIYPNPFTENINVDLLSDSKITVLDIMGNVIHTQNHKMGSNNMSTLSWPSGFYTLCVQQNEVKKYIKIIKP